MATDCYYYYYYYYYWALIHPHCVGSSNAYFKSYSLTKLDLRVLYQ